MKKRYKVKEGKHYVFDKYVINPYFKHPTHKTIGFNLLVYVYIPVSILLFFVLRWTVKTVYRMTQSERIGLICFIAIIVIAAFVYSQTLETKEQLKAKRAANI